MKGQIVIAIVFLFVIPQMHSVSLGQDRASQGGRKSRSDIIHGIVSHPLVTSLGKIAIEQAVKAVEGKRRYGAQQPRNLSTPRV